MAAPRPADASTIEARRNADEQYRNECDRLRTQAKHLQRIHAITDQPLTDLSGAILNGIIRIKNDLKMPMTVRELAVFRHILFEQNAGDDSDLAVPERNIVAQQRTSTIYQCRAHLVTLELINSIFNTVTMLTQPLRVIIEEVDKRYPRRQEEVLDHNISLLTDPVRNVRDLLKSLQAAWDEFRTKRESVREDIDKAVSKLEAWVAEVQSDHPNLVQDPDDEFMEGAEMLGVHSRDRRTELRLAVQERYAQLMDPQSKPYLDRTVFNEHAAALARALPFELYIWTIERLKVIKQGLGGRK